MVATQQHKSTIKQLQTKKKNTIQIFFFLILLHRSLSINKKVYLKYVFILQFKKIVFIICNFFIFNNNCNNLGNKFCIRLDFFFFSLILGKKRKRKFNSTI